MKTKNILFISLIIVFFFLITSYIVLANHNCTSVAPDKGESIKEKPLPPSIMPIYFLQGTFYEMGYQYGIQAAPYIKCLLDDQKALWLDRDYADSPEEKDKILKAFSYYIETECPEFVEMVEGLSEGMTDSGYPATYNDILMMQLMWDSAIDPENPASKYPETIEASSKACTAFCASGSTTKEDGQILAVSGDGVPFYHLGKLIVYPEKGNAFTNYTELGSFSENYIMNEKGLMITLTWGGLAREVDSQFGIPYPFMMLRLGLFADTESEARDILLSSKLTWPAIYLIVDSMGNISAIETTSDVKKVRKPGEYNENGDFVVATNHFVNSEIVKIIKQKPDWMATTERYDMASTFLSKGKGKVDIPYTKMIYRNYPIANPTNWTVHIGDNKNLVTYFTTGPAIKVKGGYPGGYALPIDPKYSFAEIKLKESPEETTIEAEYKAIEYIEKATTEFYKLDNINQLYTEVKEILREANTNLYKGMNYKRTAQVSTGNNNSLFCWSKAITSYITAQTLAKQAYNYIVVPITNISE